MLIGKIMSNVIKSPNLYIPEAVYASKIQKQEDAERFKAPEKLPYYSVSKELEKQDEFYKAAKSAYRRKEINKARSGVMKNAAAALIAAGAFILLEAKKII